MKITAIIDGRRITARKPYEDADHVLVDVACPTCGDLHAIVDDEVDDCVLALARGPEGIAAALVEHTRAVAVPPPAGLKLRGVDIAEIFDGWNAAAKCLRCGRIVGALEVRVSTLFGVEEDRRVLQGRCRVY